MVEGARHITHQRAQGPGVVDQVAQIVARPRAARAFEQQRVDARIDQIVFERGVVLQIDLAASLRDLVERRLRDVEMAVLDDLGRSEEHTSELQSLMRISYAVFCLKKKTTLKIIQHTRQSAQTTIHTIK